MGVWTLRRLCVLFLLLGGLSAPVRAEEDGASESESEAPTVSIAPARGSTQIPHPAGRKWKLGERACNATGRCGTVRMVTRDYAVVDAERGKAKVSVKKKKNRRDAASDEAEPEPMPPPKPKEPEPPSGFAGEDPLLIPDASPPPSSVPTAPTGPVRKRGRPSSRFDARLDASKPKRRKPLHAWWAHVQLNVMGAFRDGGAKLFSPEVSWNPVFTFDGGFEIRGSVGLTALKTDTNSYFLVLEPAIFASFAAGTFSIEPGVGAQFWLSQGGVFPLLQMNFALNLGGSDTPKFFERLFVAPGIVFSKTIPTYMVKAGFGFAF